MILFIFTINEILTEKNKKLRLGISVMGMSHSAYWVCIYNSIISL